MKYILSEALISECGRHRYALTRRWRHDGPTIYWIMLNPSTADAQQDDPTIRKCITFSKAMEAGAITVVNLYTQRATNPRDLTTPTVQEAQAALDVLKLIPARARIIAAWGADKKAHTAQAPALRALAGRRIECLGTTKDGYPRHPLYVPYTTPPIVFREATT